MQSTEINVALAPDDNYAPHAKTTIKSVAANCSARARFWILDGGLSAESVEMLKGAAENVEIVGIDRQMFAGFPSNGYITVSTWFRFAIASLLPQTVERVLYIDCDVAAAGDIAELFGTDMEGFAVAGVKDCIWRKFVRRVGLPKDFHYFNAGVLLLNLEYWRRNDVQGRLFGFLAESPDNINLFDQSILNIVLKDEYRELPLEWNAQYVPPYLEESCYEAGEFSAAMRAPKLIHYVNKFKPWSEQFGWLNPLCVHFAKYMDCAPKYPDNKGKVFLRLFLKNIFRKPGLLFRAAYWNNIVICSALKNKNGGGR